MGRAYAAAADVPVGGNTSADEVWLEQEGIFLLRELELLSEW